MPVRTSMAGAAPPPRRRRRLGLGRTVVAFACWLMLAMAPAMAQMSQPRTVTFASADGRTSLVGYLFAPAGRPKTAPAVVLLHGGSGAYSPLAKGQYSSVTLARSLRQWADLWAAQGYWALVVDSFGPRGHPAGSAGAAGSHAVVSTALRSLDAYGALRYLRASPRVRADHIALEGLASGGGAALAAVDKDMLARQKLDAAHGFRAAAALYPDCGAAARIAGGYLPYAPVRIYISAGDEGRVETCQKLAAASKAAGADIGTTVLTATMRDDDEGERSRQAVAARAAASAAERRQAMTLFAAVLGR